LGVATVVSKDVCSCGAKENEKPLNAVRYLPVLSLDKNESESSQWPLV